MRILIDIGHPGHVHLFKHFAWEMKKRGYEILFTAREKEHEIYLLKHYKFNYKSLGKHYRSKWGKIWGLLKFNTLLFFTSIKFKPDVYLSHGSIYAAQVSWILGKPHIAMEDTGNMEQVKLYKPFTKHILTSTAFHTNFGEKQIKYAGYHELAYLSSKFFTPDPGIKKILGIKPSEKSILLRFVSWNASHDIGQEGLKFQDKLKITQSLLKKNYKLFISSEQKLPPELEKYKLNLPSELIHHIEAFVDLYIGEGATMASECAILGIPAIYINPLEAGTIDDQEKYGLLFHYRSSNHVHNKVVELLSIPNLEEECQKRRAKMLADKIDVTAFLVWFVENYPESVRIMRENPDYQYRFR